MLEMQNFQRLVPQTSIDVFDWGPFLSRSLPTGDFLKKALKQRYTVFEKVKIFLKTRYFYQEKLAIIKCLELSFLKQVFTL